ncbi:hypothetical protein PanWU01x14_021280 [Parasponia andersonii]|uniref:Uncharacterized protein n=1 Tax=Parasponia andersonii TaxID=3476 RepID=A0A2P5DY01_PARAD|nr:hypothetical protein PanWU01x14_021280 [Parasponia andersonii]
MRLQPGQFDGRPGALTAIAWLCEMERHFRALELALRLSILFLRLQWLPSRQRLSKKDWIPGRTSGEIMTEKSLEGIRDSGQPRALQTVGARTTVVLQGVAEIVCMEDVSFVASRVIERKSVPTPYQHHYRPQGFTQSFPTPQASGSQGGCRYGSSGPSQGRNNKGKGKVTRQAYAFTGGRRYSGSHWPRCC